MNRIVLGIVGLAVTAVLVGCAGQTEQLSMQRPQQGPQPQAPQSVTFPNGTTFGGASGRLDFRGQCYRIPGVGDHYRIGKRGLLGGGEVAQQIGLSQRRARSR